MDAMKKIVIESKLNLLSNELQVMLWNEFCDQGFYDNARIYKNGTDFFENYLKETSLYQLVKLVNNSEAYSTNDNYVVLEDMADHNWLGNHLLASSNEPTELMQLYPDLYDEFLGYCAEWNFK